MNRSQPSKFNGKSAISVVFVFALAAPLAAEDLDPRQRTGSQASDPAVQIAGSPALLQEQVGSVAAATAQIRLTPVASHPGGAYNTGGYYTNANISGQRLTVGLGGGRTYWNAQLSNWAPATLKGYQATIGDVALLGTSADCGGGAGSCPGAGDLTYALQPCTTSANCTNAFGEAGVFGIVGGGNDGSVCRDGFCHSIFVNTTRSDWTHASVSEAFGGYGVFSFGRAVYSLSTNLQTVTDTGLDYYGGTLVIDVPAGARGVYTINWVAAETFIINGSDIVIPLAAMIPGELRVCLCNADVNNDGSVTTIDEAIVLDCIHGNCSGCVNGCDVNCDGAVDWIDMGVVRCTLQGLSDCCSRPAGACTGMQVGPSYEVCQMTLPGTCSRYLGTYHGDNTTCGGVCICNADVSGNAAVQVTDAACVADCAEGRTCACCVNGCDVDCDGTVDWADFGAVWCEFEGGSGCCDLPIGACDISQPGWPGCAETSQNACESNGGAYRGNGTTCAAPCGRAGDPPCPAGKFCEYSIGTCGSAPDGGQCTLIPAGC
ncbi:MAG: hypothetical protein Q7R41_00145, partial [Phycisphaerales bacterium]|nr:hypothetical protein [Phycisphaerales bacterium]